MGDPLGDQLATAAATGDSRQLLSLLQNNANVSAKNQFNRTALQVMKLGIPETARMLLNKGADPNLKDPTGFAILHDAARAGFLDTVQTLLEFKADVNIEDKDGNLPLHLAAQEGNLGVVECLLSQPGIHDSHRNNEGHTAQDVARLFRREDVVKRMEEHMASGPDGQPH